jgi:lipoate synthase
MSIQHDGNTSHARTGLKTTDEAVTAPKPTEIHDLLSSERRQIVIKHLAQSGPSELRKLAEVVATQIEGHQVESTDDEYDRYRVSLYQTHLDALADHNVIHFERKSGTIGLGENAAEVIDYMPDVTLPDNSESFASRLTNFF